MKVSRRKALAASLGVLPAVGILEALGQERRPAMTSGMDALLGPWLLADGFRQIGVSQFALRTAKADQVKEFAQAEINEHKELKTRLMRLGFRPAVAPAPDMPGTTPPRTPRGTDLPGTPPPGAAPGTTPPRTPLPDDTPPRTPPARTPPARTPPVDSPPARGTDPGSRPLARPDTRPGAGGAVASPILLVGSMKQELAEQCVATLTRELSKKEGAEFDRAYIGDQLSAHYELLDTVVVFKRHAGPEMRQTLATDAQPIIEKHIAWLHRIMRALMA